MGDAVAAAVLAQFAALPKTGKPQPHEHTVLAGIALSLPVASAAGDSSSGDTRQAAQPAGTQQQPREPTPHQPGVERELVVVAIATGTKCLGASKRLPGGVALNDCHAEALCRRALLRWLYTEMREVVDKYSQAVQAVHQAAQQATNSSAGGSSRADAAMGLKGLAGAASTRVLRLMPPKDGIGRAGALHSSGGSSDSNVEGTEPNDGRGTSSLCGGWRFELQPGVQLHMYVSQPPCGDASILGPMPGLAQPAVQVADGEGGCLACRCPSVVALAAAAIGDAAGSSRRAAGSSGPGAGSFGRTGAKPLKRQRMEGLDSGPQHAPASSAASAVASGACQQSSAEQQHLLQHPQHPQQQPAEVAAPEEVVQFQLPQQHEVESYGEEQATGVVRRKPGRGDATLSMSCSDKLARWCLLGLQGSLLSGLLASPLHLASLTVSVPPTTTACPAATAPEAAPGAAAEAAEAGAPAAVAIQPPPVKQQQQATGQEAAAPPGSTAAQLAAAAEAALRRALLGRTEQLARERLVGAGWPGAAEGPSLPIHLPHEEAAGDGFAAALADTPSTAAAAAAAAAAAEAPIAAAVAAATPLAHAAAPLLLTGGGSGNVSSGGASSSSAATVGQMQELGLTPSATRRVGGGSSVVWVAPPSGSFKWKQHKQRQRQQQQQQQRQQQQQLAAPAQQQAASVLQQPAPQQSASPAAALPPPVPTLLGGSVEAVAGSTGLKAGSAKTKLGQPVHPSAQASVCKAALFAAWQQLGTSLCSLPVPAPAPAECAGGAGAGAALAAAVQGSGPAEASAVAAAAAAAAGAAGLTYREAKQRAGAAYGAAWRRLLQPPSPLEGWIPKPASLEDFSLRT